MTENSPNHTVLQACRLLLRPVFRLALKSGISWKQFAESARAAMVDVATADFGKRGRPTNVSRVSILTGINRRDVHRIREELAAETPPNEGYLSPARRVLSAWHQDRDYLDESGVPAALPLDGPVPSFETLMRTHGGDVPPVALLKELLSVAAVERLADGRLRAIKRFYVPRQLDPARTMRGASALADIGNTIEFNLTVSELQKSRFERRASNESIDPRHLPAFREFLEREGMQFLERVDAWLTEHQARDGNGVRLGVGVYQVQDEEKRSKQR